jgi:hypothetical protein
MYRGSLVTTRPGDAEAGAGGTSATLVQQGADGCLPLEDTQACVSPYGMPADGRPSATSDTQCATSSGIQCATNGIQCATESGIPHTTKSSIQYATGNDLSLAVTGLSKGQRRVLQFLLANRDPHDSSRTVLLGYYTVLN